MLGKAAMIDDSTSSRNSTTDGNVVNDVDGLDKRTGSERIAAFLGDENHPPVHNFIGGKADIWRLTARCTGGGARKVDRDNPGPVNVVHWYLHRQEMVNEKTGEATAPIRTVLLDDKGQAWAWMSGGVAKSVQTMVEAMGDGPYDPPLAINVKETTSRKGMRIITFEPA